MPNESEPERGEMATLKSLLMPSLFEGGRGRLNFKYARDEEFFGCRGVILPLVVLPFFFFKGCDTLKSSTRVRESLIYDF